MAEKVTDNKQKVTNKKSVSKEAIEAAEQSPEEVLKTKKNAAKQAKSEQPSPDSRAVKTDQVKKTASKVSTPQRNPLNSRGKKYRSAKSQVQSGQEYSLTEAVELVVKTSYVKFDAAVELHVPLGIDPKQADQQVRGMVVLPHGSGKTNRVAVIASDDNADQAKAAGADKVGEDDLLEEIKQGKFDFDVLVTTPDMMSKLAKYAKELGPRGLMPNPKSGTVTTNLAKTVKELKGGRTEFRVDANGIVHQVIGKVSFKPDQLITNTKMLLKALAQAKPTGVKGVYIKRVWMTSSMGPSVKVDTKILSELGK